VRNYGFLDIAFSTFSRNEARGGGGIFNDGGMIVNNSTFAYNNAIDTTGGGINHQGDSLETSNSTFKDNSAVFGSGIDNRSTMQVLNGTFSGNILDDDGIISNYGPYHAVMTIITNRNIGDVCIGIDIIDDGYNLDSDGTCGFSSASGSLPNTDPMLGPLQDNGGDTFTHALLPSSPAINAELMPYAHPPISVMYPDPSMEMGMVNPSATWVLMKQRYLQHLLLLPDL
jgi:hypothetical protein